MRLRSLPLPFLLAGTLLTGLLVGCTPAVSTGPAQAVPPNLVVIFADDLGYGDLGAYGHPTLHTPHLDRMAREGLRFTQFYSAASVCTPSRAGLLTGRLPVRSGMASLRRRVLFPDSGGGLPGEETTLAEVLRGQGYATAMVGKWHLGHLPQHLPTNHGFDAYFGIPYSNDMSPGTNDWEGAQQFPPTPLIRGTETIEEEPDQRVLTRRYTEEAVQFIRDHRDAPFFLYFAHTFPHTPLFASDAFEGTSRRGLYGDVVEELDWSVGQVLDALRELELAENTLVFFTSDNGPWLLRRLDGGSAGLFHDGKGTTWEGGMRVPAIAWWPGTVAPATRSFALASTLDLLPTAADLAGASLPERPLDGRSLLPVLRGEAETLHETFFYYRGDSLWAVRKGPWKIHFTTQSEYVGDAPVAHDPPTLYHLEHDPSERYDVAAEHPDVVADLVAEAERHRATVEPVPNQLDLPLPE